METCRTSCDAILAEALHADALARALEAGFTKSGKGSVHLPRVGRAPGQDEGRRGHAVIREDLLGAPLVEREAEGQRVGGVVGDAEELADRGDVPLAVRAVEALGDVEDEVRPDQREPRGEAVVGLEPVDLADGAERALHRIDGGGLVPLGVEIGLREIVAERPTVEDSSEEGEAGSAPAGLAGASGLRLKASPIRTAKGALYKKGRP